ncbi:MAG: 1,4-alpha-glucan branching protein GlgB [Chlamydiia bacterium]|nr:1,4-alpha-glucan branching protein GlgB [Chlamydiia bacterium]
MSQVCCNESVRIHADDVSYPIYDEIVHHLSGSDCYDPHVYLGLHSTPNGQEIRLWRPGAEHCHIEVLGEIVPMSRIHPAGLFVFRSENALGRAISVADYRVYHTDGKLVRDPYTFSPTFGELDAYLFGKGVHYSLYNVMGGRLCEYEGVQGVKFSVWAPSARHVSLVGDFNHFDGRVNPMRSMGGCGVWELFVPGLTEGEKYKFEIFGADGTRSIKADPYGVFSEMRPATASVVARIDRHRWNDQEWMQSRSHRQGIQAPMNIYEVHLGSWKRAYGQFLDYPTLAQELGEYCKKMGFTHIELMPVAEHPLDESWGYQVTGYYAVTSRYGTPEQFQAFVDHMHRQGIGVIIDWVPAHFPSDAFGLARFDGTSLYEHVDPREGFHPHWQTYIFNYGRHEVSNFLIANALYWFEVMHIDGLRVDAVASMLYRDYGRNEGEWIPNRYGGRENIEAIDWMKHLNSIIHQRVPGALMIAEESTAFGGVTTPVQWNGLGFDLKWNMGWMNDTLRYFERDSLYRCHHQHELTFGLLYAYSEKFALVLSHDEVVHGKRSLLDKMPGDLWQKFAGLRLLLSYQICQPGKKLLFMGGEIGQWGEWNCQTELEWNLLSYDTHSGVQKMVEEINHLYLNEESMWSRDGSWTGFEWVDFADHENSVISYLRHGNEGSLLCLHHFTPNTHARYRLALPGVKKIEEIFNSDDRRYGGSGVASLGSEIERDEQGNGRAVWLHLPPLATVIYRVTR